MRRARSRSPRDDARSAPPPPRTAAFGGNTTPREGARDGGTRRAAGSGARTHRPARDRSRRGRRTTTRARSAARRSSLRSFLLDEEMAVLRLQIEVERVTQRADPRKALGAERDLAFERVEDDPFEQ